MEVEMKIRGLMMDPSTNLPIVVLKDVNGGAVLPIWVGIYEANAIALEIEKIPTARPMTHDLIRNLLFGLETGVKKVVVSDLKEDTYYAVIWLERDGKLISVDSRPSDALAIALRLDCPIYVEETVLKTSKTAAAVAEVGGLIFLAPESPVGERLDLPFADADGFLHHHLVRQILFSMDSQPLNASTRAVDFIS